MSTEEFKIAVITKKIYKVGVELDGNEQTSIRKLARGVSNGYDLISGTYGYIEQIGEPKIMDIIVLKKPKSKKPINKPDKVAKDKGVL